jgi:aryl-phospho-beta-D-glucosidase BglC (GH1 family)
MRTKRRIRRVWMVCVVWSFLLIFLGPAGAATAASPGWHTGGTQILNPVGAPFIITGINWYGFETTGFVAHGLYARDYTSIVDEIKQYGYNTIRIPFSNQMWETNPVPNPNTISACKSCQGKHSRDIMALIVSYAGGIGLHVILDNHRSEAGNSAEANGLWYSTSRGQSYPEQSWTNDWVSVQQWVHGILQTLGAPDTLAVTYLASDGFPTVLGYDLRDEPHTPSRTPYLSGATWGTGDGISPASNPNPNPFAPSCVASSTCHDWRLAAERAGDTILGDAYGHNWQYPLIFVEGISQYPTATGTAANGPYDYYWWGGNLLGVNGNANNAGAPIVLTAGGSGTSLGANVYDQLAYSAHDYGPALFQQGYFNSSTCYQSGCSASSLADVWHKYWAFVSTVSTGTGTGEIKPASFSWGSYTSYDQAPIYLGEFGTGNNNSDLYSSGPGSQGQWFTDIVNFIQSSYNACATSSCSGYPVRSLNWTYWALNTEDSYALLGNGYTGLANPSKEYSFLCSVQQGPLAVPPGSGGGQCGGTGALPGPS